MVCANFAYEQTSFQLGLLVGFESRKEMRLIQAQQKPIHNFPILFSLVFVMLVSGAKLAGQNSGTTARATSTSRRRTAESAAGNRCNASMFVPNYAAEVGVFGSERWERFPITIWIDPSTVRDAEEMSSLRTGLSSWSEATSGVLGVSFLQAEQDAQIKVRIVDMLDGANGITHHTVTDRGFIRSATIDIVRPRWVGAPYAQYKSSVVSRLAAHEMGHVLGIVRHAATPGTIMLPNSATDFPAPLDVNTIKAKYCELFPH